jgi:methyltransferase (TIGR00027 family)
MRKTGPSRTAELAAMTRALARHSSFASKVMNDPLAKYFAGPPVMIPYLFNRVSLLLNPWFWKTGINSVGFLIALCRHRYMNDLLSDSIGDGFKQVILLGAGYDTSFLRIQEKIDGVRLIEIDHPNTQVRKKRIIRDKNLRSRMEVNYVGLDLSRNDIYNQLGNIDIKTDEPILVIAEGVLSYLISEAFDQVIQSVSGLGNRVRFAADYRYPQMVDKNAGLPVRRWRLEFKWMKEKYKSYFSQQEMDDKLQNFGFNTLNHINLSYLWKKFTDENAPKHLANVAGLFVVENR